MVWDAALVVAVFVVVLAALLAVPITLRFRVDAGRDGQTEAQLVWAFGLVRIRIRDTGARARKSAEARKPVGKHRRRPRRKLHPIHALRHRGFRRRMLKFVADVWRAFRKQDLSVRLRVGLGDPADTGQLWGLVGPIAGLLATIRDAAITVEPDFGDASIEFHTHGSIRLVPLELVYLVLALLLSPSVWQGIKRLRAVEV